MCGSRMSHRSYRGSAAERSEPRVGPEMRASDADREAVVHILRDHAAAGRLSTEELEERIARALEARTFADLEVLQADLPARPDPRRAERRHEIARRALREHMRTYVMVMTLLVAIWALTGMGYFWPVWPMVGWGIGLWSHAACTPRRRRAPARDALAGI